MGDRIGQGRMTRPSRAPRHRQMTLIHAVMTCLVLLIFLQILLLMVAAEAFLNGERDILVPITLVSGLCFAASCWLIRPVYAIPARRRAEEPGRAD